MNVPAPDVSGALVTFGETMGLFAASRIGQIGVGRSFVFGIGGAESNVAIGAARLGTAVTWFGRVGSDAIGTVVERLIASEGVETLAIHDPGFTGLMVKHERHADFSHVDYHRSGSAGSHLQPDDIPERRLRTASVLHVTGITAALSASARATVHAAIEIARSAGVCVSFDVNYRRKLWAPDEAAPVLGDIASRCDIVFAGREESDLVTGGTSSSTADAAVRLGRLGIKEAIIKDGAHGCSAVVDGSAHRLPAPRVRVVDPVGAGDAFVAAYLAERLGGADVDARLSTAVKAGAFAVSVPGDCENLPYRTDLENVRSDVAR